MIGCSRAERIAAYQALYGGTAIAPVVVAPAAVAPVSKAKPILSKEAAEARAKKLKLKLVLPAPKRRRRGGNKLVNLDEVVTKKLLADAKRAAAVPFDKVAYQREYMRKRRAALKEKA
jgi:hypothetical protein